MSMLEARTVNTEVSRLIMRHNVQHSSLTGWVLTGVRSHSWLS